MKNVPAGVCAEFNPLTSLEISDEDLSADAMAYCRVCFESDQDRSSLISPCDCRGSCLFIHVHCLDKWQETALHSNLPERATTCPICKGKYRYPSQLYMHYRRVVHLANFHISVIRAIFSFLWMSFFILPLKILIHAVLVIITLPFGSFSLNGKSLTWIGYDFPPQLAIIHDSNGVSLPGLQAGVLLVATDAIPVTSIFHKAVILILEHTVEYGSKGVVLNCLSRNLRINDYLVGNGGPMEQEICTVVHSSKLCSRYSYILSATERLYVAEGENAYPTLKQLAHVRNRLATLASIRAAPAAATTAASDASAAQESAPSSIAVPVADVRVLRGSCVWSPYQLDGEVLAGQWHVLPGRLASVFAPLPESASTTHTASVGRAPGLGREPEGNPGHRLYANQRTRNATQVCDESHWQALRALALGTEPARAVTGDSAVAPSVPSLSSQE